MENEETITALPTIIPQQEIACLEHAVEAAEKYVQLMGKIRLMAAKLLNKTDVSNQGGKPYIEKSGCDKIAAAFGVRIFDTEFLKEREKDEKGEYLIYTCTGSGSWNNHTEREIGTCSTRDDFFGKVKGELKPISEIDLTDIKKKAYTGFANRIIKKLIGLSFTWEELAELSGGTITSDGVSRVEYGKGKQGGNVDSPATKKLRDECMVMLLKLNDGEASAAQSMLIAETAFTGKDGKQVPGKDQMSKLSERQVEILHGKLKKKVADYDKAVQEGYGA